MSASTHEWDMLKLMLGCFVGLLCYGAGWVAAHQTVATECKRLGGFFVGSSTFKCHAIKAQE